MNATFVCGTLPLWRNVPRTRRSLRGPDELRGDYRCALGTVLNAGDAVPGYPGMIIIDLDEMNTGLSREYGITAEGSLDNTQLHKILSRGRHRTLESGWDERSVRYLSSRSEWRNCTAAAATEIVTTSSAHGFSSGQRIVFARLTGGAGITPQSSSSLGTVYFFHVLSSTTGKLCTTYADAIAGTNFVNITTDMSAGQYIAAEFALGAPHPDCSGLFLCELTQEDEFTDWKQVTCAYRGLEEDKPYHRIVTVNGQQFASSSPITISATDGWADARYTNFHLPEIVVTDTYLATSALATSLVPSFATPANAPAIASYVLTDDTDNLTWNYPYGWTLVGVPQQSTLNSQISAHVFSYVYRYIWPVMFR